jgi:hypothetical protein
MESPRLRGILLLSLRLSYTKETQCCCRYVNSEALLKSVVHPCDKLTAVQTVVLADEFNDVSLVQRDHTAMYKLGHYQ